MNRSRDNGDRLRRCLDRLTNRIDAQALQRGGDAPHLVSLVGAFHAHAGRLERRIEERPWWLLDPADVARDVRVMLRMVAAHATMVRLQRMKNAAAP